MNDLLNKEKGEIGEQKIFDEINNIDIYNRVLRNIRIPVNNSDKTTEIDIILITCDGLYIIESKNWNGIISRTKKDDWYMTFNFKKMKHINSPVKQNKYHIDYLMQYLGLDISYFKSYIVFNEKNKLKDNCFIDEDNLSIIKSNDIFSRIIKDIKEKEIILSHEEIDKIYAKLKYMNY